MAGVFSGLRERLSRPHVFWTLIVVVVGVLVAVVGGLISGQWLDFVVIGAALMIIGMMVVVLRTYFTLEREERLDRGIEGREDPGPTTAAAQSLDQRFANEVAEIRGSRLGEGGLVALPWLMTLGPQGDGKTAAVRFSGLDMPAEYATRVTGAPTESCDWWLTNEAIVLDMAGRFLSCESDVDVEEWQRLLALLRKQRPGCAINGLVFVISVDTLLGRGAAELEEMARQLRRRINELTDELGVDLPIYIMVSKVDHIEGFVECVNASPMMQPGEALGWTSDQRFIADPESRVKEAFQPLVRRLEAVLPELILREPDRIRRRRIFVFPREFETMVEALARFVGRAFAETPYDAPPFLRGVYFSSARREGRTSSPLLHRLGQDWARADVVGSLAEGGYMLRDFFREIVIGDRTLALPIDRFGKSGRRALNAACGFVFALVAIWWGISFVTNFMGIGDLRSEARGVVRGATSLAQLDEFREIIEAETADVGVLRRGGLGGPLDRAAGRAKQTYVAAFDRELAEPTRRKLMAVVKRFDTGAFEALAQLAINISWLNARADEERAARPDLLAYAPVSSNETDQEAFRRGYDAFVRWSSHGEVQAEISREQETLAQAAARLLELRRLETWAETSSAYPPRRYSDFDMAGADAADTEVSGAYTREAWDGLVSGLLAAIDVTGAASGKAREFRKTFTERFDEKWRAFLMDAPTRGSAHAEVATSPPLRFLVDLDENTRIELPRGEAGPPDWILFLREVRRTEAPPAAPGEEGEEEGEDAPPPIPWEAYEASLEPVAADAEAAREDRQVALALAMDMAARKPTSFSKAVKLAEGLIPQEMAAADRAAAEKIEKLLEMPALDAASSAMSNALSLLDSRWQSRIVEPYSGTLTNVKLRQLYSGQGAVAEFRRADLKGFYRDGRATSLLGGRSLPMGRGFLAWMKDAERLQRIFDSSAGGGGAITVQLAGVPAVVQGNSRMKVAEREIVLQCASGTQTYRYNEGMPIPFALRWSPDCTTVRLRITVVEDRRKRELRPAREWKGPMALPEFLQEASASGNELVWSLRYPDAGVRVTMTYRLREGRELLSMRHRPPPRSMRN